MAITTQTISLANSEKLAQRALNRFQTQKGKVFEGKLNFKNKTFSEACEIIESQDLKIDQKLYLKLIKCISKTEFVALKYFFENTPREINKVLIKNTKFFNRIITHGKKGLDFFPLAKLAYEQAKELNLANSGTFNCFIKVAYQNKKFDEGFLAFNEAKTKGLAKQSTYYLLVKEAEKNRRFEEVKIVCQDAKKNNISLENPYAKSILNKVQLYSAALPKVEKKNNYRKSLKQINKEIIKDNLTLFSYQFNQLIYRNRKIDLITLEYFFENTPKNLRDAYFYNAIISHGKRIGFFDLAKRAYEEALKSDLTNSITFTLYIDVAGSNNKYEEAKKSLEEAKKNGLVNTETYNRFITIAGKNNKYEEMKLAFEEAKQKKLANDNTYNNFIYEACCNYKLEDAKEAYEEGKALGLVLDNFSFDTLDSSKTTKKNVAQNVLIRQQSKIGKYSKQQQDFKGKTLNEAFTLIERLNLKITSKIFNRLMACEMDFASLEYFFNNTPASMRNVYFLNAIISHGKKGMSYFILAKKAFEEAKKNTLADSYSYNLFLTAAGKNNKFEDVQQTLEEAENVGLADIVTYNSFIEEAGNNNQFEEAKKMFEKVIKLGIADSYTHKNFKEAEEKNRIKS